MDVDRLPWLALLACAIAPSAAWAQQDIQLDTRMFVERVQTDINGRPRRTVTNSARPLPGDQLIFVVDWRNIGARPVRGFSVVRPVPRGSTLDLTDALMQVSVDGGDHWGRIEQLWLPTDLGGTRRAVATDITHVRWLLQSEISPGESGRLSYRAIAR